jgi:hypothetical protein
MKRHWNVSLWAGFILVLAGFLSYIPLFALFPATRDFPWANLLIFAAGGGFLWIGLKKAFRQPTLYRGKIAGPILAGLSSLVVLLFCYGFFYEMRRLPSASSSPQPGAKAPDFALQDQHGKTVTLEGLLATSPPGHPGTKARGVLLIFYRGHW